MPKVYNKHLDKGKIPDDAVYIGRPSVWGNPWMALNAKDRDAVCDMYEEYLSRNPELVRQIKKFLKGRDLVCFCAPKRCHGDTILRIANEED